MRFVFSSDEKHIIYDGDGASIAEIIFISDKGDTIKGKPAGSPGRKYNSYTAVNCFDGDPLTFFEDARNNVDGKYVGLELEYPMSVKKIKYLARNDMNSIQPGDEYELFFWDNTKFESLGRKVAINTFIEYENVPCGAILWLRDLSRGKEERIFTYENNQQVWW